MYIAYQINYSIPARESAVGHMLIRPETPDPLGKSSTFIDNHLSEYIPQLRP